jgi:uracil-DNA glycosylase
MFKVEVHPLFQSFYQNNLSLLQAIYNEIKHTNYTPEEQFVLRFLKLDLSSIKVVIIGQDPYPQKNAANGRSFQVNTLTSWHIPFRQVSLKNIIRNIYYSYYDEYLTFNQIKEKMLDASFPLKNPKEWFDSLENQGVLFLNLSFTCLIDKPNSHKHLWQEFSKNLIEYIDNYNPQIKWFLWGNEARSIAFLIKGIKYESNHPMMCSLKNNADFLYNRCFKETKDIINWLG